LFYKRFRAFLKNLIESVTTNVTKFCIATVTLKIIS
jgi:hypothetical protein